MADDSARVNMVWPKGLKERVKEKTGHRGLTEFVLEATELHLQGSAEVLANLERDLNETKYLAQLLADRIAMGGSSVDRLEAFMELELPSWLDTSGWPSEFAKRVRPEVVEPESPTLAKPELPELPPEVVREVPTLHPEPEPDSSPTPPASASTSNPDPLVEVDGPESLPINIKADKDDLFAKIMAATGGDPLMSTLKPASEIPRPDPVVQRDLCPTCGEELVDGECWTC